MKITLIILALIVVVASGVCWTLYRDHFTKIVVLPPDFAPIKIEPANDAGGIVSLDATQFPRIALAGRVIDFPELDTALRSYDKDTSFLISTSESTDYTALVQILDTLKKSGHSKIAYAAPKPTK